MQNIISHVYQPKSLKCKALKIQQDVNIAQEHACGHAPLAFVKGRFGRGPAAFTWTKADLVVEVI